MQFRNSEKKWGTVSVFIHWLSALTIIGLFALGLWMVDLTYYDDWYKTGPDIHKSIGVILFLLTLLRFFWRFINTNPGHLNTHSVTEITAATWAHRIIYALLILIMCSGYLISTADGRGVDVFGLFSVPATLHDLDQQEDIAGLVHWWLAVTLISLVAIHALGALKHHFIDKDSTLVRMFGK